MIAQNWKCSSCGHVAIGLFPPEKCPKCGSPRAAFKSEHKLKIPDEEVEAVISACWKVTYGLYVISSIDGDRVNGQVCNTLFQITSDPPRMAIGINHRNLTHEFIEKSGVFAASVLGRDDHKMVRRFGYRSGRDFDKFRGVDHRKARNGCPVLEGTVGWLECSLVPSMNVDAGTHMIFVADITGGGVGNGGEPMTYAHYTEEKNRSTK